MNTIVQYNIGRLSPEPFVERKGIGSLSIEVSAEFVSLLRVTAIFASAAEFFSFLVQGGRVV
jgi:hypothetical protein